MTVCVWFDLFSYFVLLALILTAIFLHMSSFFCSSSGHIYQLVILSLYGVLAQKEKKYG